MSQRELLTRETVTVVEDTGQVQDLLDGLTLDDCFHPETWPGLVGIAQIVPDGEVLPVRAAYGAAPGWNIGLNHFHTDQPVWYIMADLAAAKLRTGTAPRVLRALRFAPGGDRLPGLAPVRLRGDVTVDPARQDFFRTVVEERQRLKAPIHDHPDDCSCQDCSLAAFLKVLANAGSFGIFAEMNRQEQPGRAAKSVTVHGAHNQPWTCSVAAPERPGRFCFPPVAACITGAARLMLAMVERCITDAGGTSVFCDTDSMAIVADQTGSLIPCPGGPQTMPDGRPAVQALTLDQVEAIRHRFAALSPYGPGAVTDILKREFVGYCYAISAKRYVLYHFDPSGVPVIDYVAEEHEDDIEPGMGIEAAGIQITKNSEHGLGHLLNPTDPDSDDRNWIRQLWGLILADAHGIPVAEPDWLDRPALTRITVSSPALLRPFATWNTDRPYPDQVKPSNFLLAAHTAPLGHPPGAETRPFRLIAPYEADPRHWTDLPWRNLYDPHGRTYRITTTRWDHTRGDQPDDLVQVKTYRTVLHEYRRHPESKSAGPDGQPCGPDTTGLLTRRTVHLAALHHIGKEANRLDDVQAGLVTDLDEVLTDYGSPRNTLAELILPALAGYTAVELAQLAGTSQRTIERIRTGAATPRPDLRQALSRLAVDTALADFRALSIPNPWEQLPVSAAYRDWEAALAHHKDATRDHQRRCPCGCGTLLRPRQTYANEACRKRHQRRNKK